jgi:hypothetical protein
MSTTVIQKATLKLKKLGMEAKYFSMMRMKRFSFFFR